MPDVKLAFWWSYCVSWSKAYYYLRHKRTFLRNNNIIKKNNKILYGPLKLSWINKPGFAPLNSTNQNGWFSLNKSASYKKLNLWIHFFVLRWISCPLSFKPLLIQTQYQFKKVLKSYAAFRYGICFRRDCVHFRVFCH